NAAFRHRSEAQNSKLSLREQLISGSSTTEIRILLAVLFLMILLFTTISVSPRDQSKDAVRPI
ncbi:MAG: hypothetical protein RR217_06150, partial [Mucinivorans sp.]